jgi:probable rRNA maturation factor
MIVDVLCRAGCRRVPVGLVRETALRTLGSMRCRAGQVSVLLTHDAEIRALNRRFRGKDSSTDVLSFPGEEGPDLGEHLGDVVISVETAARHAREAGWRLRDEIPFLVIHGILHLLGYDHVRDRGEMDRLQSRLARRLLGRAVPEIRRAPDLPPAVGRRRARSQGAPR